LHRGCGVSCSRQLGSTSLRKANQDGPGNGWSAPQFQSGASGQPCLYLAFDMMVKRAVVVGICSGLGLICLGLVWALGTAPQKQPEGLIVTFAGWTNGASGEILAQFDIANSFAHRVQVGVGELQFREASGWPSPSMLGAGTGDWLSIEAGSHLVFSVPAPSLEEATWRVPIIYEEDLPLAVGFFDRITGVDFGSVHWRPARRAHRASFVVGPEMVGLSNKKRNADNP
jgi:hypothetical protein